MAAGATYEPIATQTLASAAASITFSSIAASWTDLKLVLTCTTDVAGKVIGARFNSDTATNYSSTELIGNGGSAASNRNTSVTSMTILDEGTTTTIPLLATMDIFSYAGSTYKTSLITESSDQNGTGSVRRDVWLWRSVSAITTIGLFPNSGNFAIGTTATLYGIKAA